jgi:hypothetical protein
MPARAVLVNGFSAQEAGLYRECEKTLDRLQGWMVSQGTRVTRFGPEDSPEDLLAALEGADALIYEGHGVIHNVCADDGRTLDVGGLALGRRVLQPARIARVRLAPDAQVLLSRACFAAGSGSRDRAVAEGRMARYSQAFLEAGAAVYLAHADAERFLRARALGRSVEEAYGVAAYRSGAKSVRTTAGGYPLLFQEALAGPYSTRSALVWRTDLADAPTASAH